MMNKEEEFVEKIKSKNWKERQEVYVELGNIWKKSDEYSNLVVYLQNEVNLPALESAIEAIMSLKKPPKLETVHKIFIHIGNSKTTIKNKIISLVLYLAQDHLEDLILELCGILGSKTPKNVSNSISCLIEISKKFDIKLNLVGDKLGGIFAHTDKNVRSEGVKFSVELYKQHGDEIRKYLSSLKPIQMKELEEEFGKYKVEDKDEHVFENKISVSSSLLKRMDDEKWNVRLEALNELKENIKSIELTNELMSSLFRKINDPNNQVLFSTLDIYSIIKPKNQRIINSLIERLKDKKPVVTDKIKHTLIQMKLNPENVPIDFFKHKSPQIKYNIIDYCILAKLSQESIVKSIITCLSDSSCEVRTIAYKALNVLEYDRNFLPDQVRNKLNSATPVAKKEGISVIDQKSIFKSNKDHMFERKNEVVKKVPEKTQEVNKNNYFGPTDSEKKEVLERFYTKYPFFNEKMWNLRLEEFKAHYKYLVKEDIKDLANFFFANKEANFHLNLEFMNLLIKRKTELNHVKNTVMLYCLDKITEIKLKNKIQEVFQNLDRRDAVLFLINEVENYKQGKKFCSILSLLGKLVKKGDNEVERIFKKQIIGLQEKKAYEELRNVYENLVEEISISEDEVEEDQPIKENFKEVSDSKLLNNNGNCNDKRNNLISTPIMLENVFEDKSKPNKNIVEDSFKEIKSFIETEDTKETIKDEIFGSNIKIIEPIKSEFNSAKNIFPMKKKLFNKIEVLKSNIPRNRMKGKGCFEDVFTKEFIKIMKTEDFNLVIDYFEKIDMVIVSDHIINYYVQQKLSSTFFNSLILHFISKKYILCEIECRILLTYLLEAEMKEELEMMDRIYPVTKLFIILQKIRTDNAVDEILRLISKYNIFRGNKKMFIDELKKNNRQALKTTLEGCPDFLSFIDEIEETFKTSTKVSRIEEKGNEVFNDVNLKKLEYGKVTDVNTAVRSHKLDNLNNTSSLEPINTKKISLEGNTNAKDDNSIVSKEPFKDNQVDFRKETNQDVYKKPFSQIIQKQSPFKNHEKYFKSPQVNGHYTSQNNFEEIVLRNKLKENFEKQDLIAPSVLDDSFNIDDVDIENSLDCLSISSNIGVSTPNLKKFRKEFFTPIKKRESIESLESILDNLIDSNQEKSEQAFKKLSDLIKNNINSVLFSANSIISSISIQLLDVLYRPLYATLILNVLLKLSQSKLFCEQLRKETLENVNIDLINMMNSLNKANKKENASLVPLVGDIITNLCINSKPSISLEVYLDILTGKREEISLKLIWRHSKALIMRNKEEIQNIIDLFECFYSKNVYSIILNDNTTFKVLTLHVKEIVNYYSTEIYKFDIGKFTKVLVDFIIQKKDINVKEFRYKIENNCNI